MSEESARDEGSSAAGYRVWAVAGIPEVQRGDDLAKLIAAAEPGLRDGDVLLVTSKIVSKAEGRLVEAADREAAIDAETVRVVARRGALRIVENRQGLVMAALIAYTVITIRKLDELGQRIQLVAIAASFAVTGGISTLYAFLVKAGMPSLEWAIWLWPFMSLVWGVSVLVINRRYR